jgi:hypothetical protein
LWLCVHFAGLGIEHAGRKHSPEIAADSWIDVASIFAAALRDAIRERLIPDQDCEAKARDLFGCVMGVLLEAKIET